MTIHVMVVHASIVSGKPKVELNSHSGTHVVSDNCLVIHDHNKPVNIYSYNTKDDHRSAKTVDAEVEY